MGIENRLGNGGEPPLTGQVEKRLLGFKVNRTTDAVAFSQSTIDGNASDQWRGHLFQDPGSIYFAAIGRDRQIIWAKGIRHDILFDHLYAPQGEREKYVRVLGYATSPRVKKPQILILPMDASLNETAFETAAYFQRSLGDGTTHLYLEYFDEQGEVKKFERDLAAFNRDAL